MALRFAVLVAALAVWFVYFYLLDKLILAGQGLPVGWDLMPIS